MVNWNEQADARLLVGVLTTTHQKLDYNALAKFMGPDCTVSAVQHRIQRLKEKIKMPPSDNGKPSASAAPATPNASPAKRGRGRPKKNAAVAAEEQPQAKKAKTEDEDCNDLKHEEDA